MWPLVCVATWSLLYYVAMETMREKWQGVTHTKDQNNMPYCIT